MSLIYALVVQLVEHMTFNHGVAGSIPVKRTMPQRLEAAIIFHVKEGIYK